jgi:hypothetical protein
MKTIKERAKAIYLQWAESTEFDSGGANAYAMGCLLQEIANAPEPEPVAHAILLPNGATRIWFSDRDSGELWRAREGVEQELTPLYTAPPAPSVPDSKTLQFLTDVLTAAGLLRHGKKDAGLATRIADESCRIRQQLFTQPEQPADLVRDAERYRWLRNWTRGAYGIDSKPAFILPHVPTVLDQNIMSGSVAQHLDNAIDAAIERDKMKGGA